MLLSYAAISTRMPMLPKKTMGHVEPSIILLMEARTVAHIWRRSDHKRPPSSKLPYGWVSRCAKYSECNSFCAFPQHKISRLLHFLLRSSPSSFHVPERSHAPEHVCERWRKTGRKHYWTLYRRAGREHVWREDAISVPQFEFSLCFYRFRSVNPIEGE